MSYNFVEIIKKLHFLVSRKPARGLPTPSPPPLRGPLPHIFHVLDGKCGPRVRLLLGRITSGRGRGREGWFAKDCHSITDHRIDCKFKMKIANSILLLCYLDKICLTLTGGSWQALAIYIVKGGYKREPEPAASPQSATPHSTGNISVKEGSQPQQHTWNSKALFFPT